MTDTLKSARAAVAASPNSFIDWVILAEEEINAGDIEQGILAAKRALQINPGHPEALARLGRAHWMQKRFHEAAQTLHAAYQRAPFHPGICIWFAHALEDISRPEDAAKIYAHAYQLAPNESQIAAYLLAWKRKLCDWEGIDQLSAQVREAVRSQSAIVEPFAFLSEDSTAQEQLLCAQTRARSIQRPEHFFSSSSKPRAAGNQLKVGLLSNGFGSHPTGLLIVKLIEELNNRQLDIHLFATTPNDGSAIRTRLENASTVHDISGHSHTQSATLIRNQEIDILFDLRGWGGGGSPEILALRPASIQINWLAYPGTSGAPWIDYILADKFVLPDDISAFFSEKVIYLPHCFQPSDNTRILSHVLQRQSLGLPENAFVFCCFNNSYKLNTRSMMRIFQIMKQVPDSVLWLLSTPGEGNTRLQQAAQRSGIDSTRLVYMHKKDHLDYLACLQTADLFLDTTPYNAHTTASDALWAGCPVITTPGDTFASRVAGSLNHHLGMDELNRKNDEDFIHYAVELASDKKKFATIKSKLMHQRQHSLLFDMQNFAKSFENIMVEILQKHAMIDHSSLHL